MKLPQISLRDLFWLMLVVAMGCGWWWQRSEVVLMTETIDTWRERYIRLAINVEKERALLEPRGWRFEKEGNHPNIWKLNK